MTRPRVAVAGVWHETNVFGPHRATLDRFREYELLSGGEIRDRHHDVKTVIGGFLDGLGWADVDAVKNDQLYEVKSAFILQPGPALFTDGAAQVARIIRAAALGEQLPPPRAGDLRGAGLPPTFPTGPV